MAVTSEVVVQDRVVGSDVPIAAGGPRSPLVSVLYGTLALLSAQPITWAAALLTTAFIPRFLDARDLGQYTVALTLVNFIATVLGLGVTTALTRRVAARPLQAEADATAGLVLLVGLSVPVAVAMALIGPWLGLPIDDAAVLPIALATMVTSMAHAVLSAVLIGQQRHLRFAWLNGLSVALTAVAGVAVLFAGGNLAAYMAVGAAVSGVTTILSWCAAGLGFNRSALSPTYLLHLVHEGLPFLGSNLANRLRGDIEIALLAALLTQQAVGWWGAATRIIAIPIFIPSLLTTPLLPALSRCTDDPLVFERTLRRSLVLALILIVPASAMILALAPAIPDLLGWRAEFQNAVPLMMALSMHMPLVAIGMVLGAGLFARGVERPWMMVNWITTILSGGSALVTISVFDSWFQNGALGMAVVRVLCELVMIAGAFILLPRGTIDGPTISSVVRIMMAGACLTATSVWLIPSSLVLAVASGGIAYIVGLLALRVVRLADLVNALAMARELPVIRRRFTHTTLARGLSSRIPHVANGRTR